jgi:hypothetical protein
MLENGVFYKLCFKKRKKEIEIVNYILIFIQGISSCVPLYFSSLESFIIYQVKF